MSRREIRMMEKIRRDGIQYHVCGKHLNVNNLEYTPKAYPYGSVEMVPTCHSCANGGD